MSRHQPAGVEKTKPLLVNVYIALVCIIAGAISYLLVISSQTSALPFVHFLLWMVLVVIADIAPIKLPKGEAVLSVGGAIDIGIVLLFPTGMAALAGFVSGVVSSVARKIEIRKIFFNASMNIIMMTAASEVIRLFGAKLIYFDPSDIASWPIGRVFPAIIVSTIVYFTVNTGLTSIAISLDSRKAIINVWRRNYMWTIVTSLAIAPIGLILAVVYYVLSSSILFAIIGSLIFVFPIFVVRSSFKWFAGANLAYFNSIKALISALDASHPYTQGHSIRVAQNAIKVAQALKLSDREIEKIEQGAVLHDIGKIGLDKSILDKDGPLTPYEWARVKMHPVQGSNIVKDLSFLQNSKSIILHHHERIDGRGYPAGIRGDDIPIAARIVNVVDALDALTSDRSYRQALSAEEAIKILHVNANTQFDYQIVIIVDNLYKQGSLIFQSENTHEEPDEILFTLIELNTVLTIK